MRGRDPRYRGDDRCKDRLPAVAGIFYPEEPRALADLLDRFAPRSAERQRVVAAVVPHGGYVDSGPVAAEVYSRIQWPAAAVVMGPNHAGMGIPFSIVTRGVWATPLGKLPIHAPLAEAIQAELPDLKEDPLSHRQEHSIEVQLPFLQRLGKVKGFVPLLMSAAELPQIRKIGKALAEALLSFKKEVLLVATTHLSEQEPLRSASVNDRLVLDRILALDEEGLFQTVKERSLSLCGLTPAAVCLVAAKNLSASGAVLVKYQTVGGWIPGHDSVVGYAGVLIQ